jgi:predicted HicB family RNase H-like nuclease
MDLDYREGVSPTVSNSGQEESTARKTAEAGAKLAAEMKVFEQVALELSANRNTEASHDARCSQVLREASELFGVAPTWTAFYRVTLGVEGCIRQLFHSADEMCAYECSDAHEKVLEMLTVLRSRDVPECDPYEAQRMITVRIPKSLHDSICQEANDLQVSVNKLCVTRMLQRIDRQLIPTSTQKRRGRRPGAEYSKTSASANTQSPMTDGMDAA